MITISNSEIQAWKRCPRMWYVNYYLGFVPAQEPATGTRQLGTRVHLALEGHYGHDLDALTVLAVLYKIAKDAQPEYEAELTAEHGLAHAMVEGYLEWLADEGADADLEVVHTEQDVQVPLPGFEDQVTLRARMDQVSQRISDGVLSFMDYKTAANFEKHELLDLDPQFRFYCLIQWLLAGHGAPAAVMQFRDGLPVVDGGIITTLRRIKRTSKSKPPYYQRDYFRYNPEVIQATLVGTQKVAREILTARSHLDAAQEQHADLFSVNLLQRHELRPVPILTDCSWRCPLASGTCTAMDDGSDWPGILESSGRFRQADPYEYYRSDGLSAVREKLASL